MAFWESIVNFPNLLKRIFMKLKKKIKREWNRKAPDFYKIIRLYKKRIKKLKAKINQDFDDCK